MHAREARRLTDKGIARATLDRVFGAIKKAAEQTGSSLVLSSGELTPMQAELLRQEFGYTVVEDRGEPSPTGENRRIIKWTIEW